MQPFLWGMSQATLEFPPYQRGHMFFLGGDFLTAWKAKCPIFKAIVAGFRGKVV